MAQESTLRADLESAIEQFEQEEIGDEGTSTGEVSGTEAQAASEVETDSGTAGDSPRQASADDAGAAGEDHAASSGEGADASGDDSEGAARRRDTRGRFLADEAHPEDAERYTRLTEERVAGAPEGWRPAAREGWSELPESVRREIHRREIDISTGMQESKDARDHHSRFRSVVEPFTPVLAAHGISDPLEGVEKLLSTAAALKLGSPEQKAAKLVSLIQDYGVEVEALDHALAAHIKGEPTAPKADPMLDARLAPLEQFVQGLQGQIQTVEQQRAQTLESEMATFRAQAEFIDDVRLDMADLLDVAAQRSRPLTLQQAYDTACQMNPEVRGVLERRAAAERTATAATKVAAKRELADSSLTSAQPAAGGARPANGSLRDDILRAWDTVEETR